MAPPAFLVLLAHARAEPGSLRRCKPRSLFRPVGQVAYYYEAERDRGQTFEQEKPLPARESQPPTEAEQRTREGIPHHTRERDGNHELGDGSSPLSRRKPSAQVVNDPGEETGFGHPQQEAQPVESERAAHEHHG